MSNCYHCKKCSSTPQRDGTTTYISFTMLHEVFLFKSFKNDRFHKNWMMFQKIYRKNSTLLWLGQFLYISVPFCNTTMRHLHKHSVLNVSHTLVILLHGIDAYTFAVIRRFRGFHHKGWQKKKDNTNCYMSCYNSKRDADRTLSFHRFPNKNCCKVRISNKLEIIGPEQSNVSV